MRIWDLPLRIFHWALMLSVIGAIASSKAGVMWAHERLGLTVMGLVIFRLIWGFVGGHHARFVNFVTGPRAVFSWLRMAGENSVRQAGHSPLAAYSVLALLGVAGFMAGSGSVSNDGILFDGPMAHLLSMEASKQATSLHHLGQYFVFALVGLHVVAILFYKFVKRQGLTAAMVHGRASDPADRISGVDGGISTRHTLFGFGLMVACVALAQMLPLLRPVW